VLIHSVFLDLHFLALLLAWFVVLHLFWLWF